MDKIAWPVLEVSHVTLKDFVLFWERLYSYPKDDENFYEKNIGKPLTKRRIDKWFNWKNGRDLSAAKLQSIRRYLTPEERIARDADQVSLAKFLQRPGGTIWRIFWLHLQHHRDFPIYDQHVHRAMAYLLKLPEREIPGTKPEVVSGYLEDYRPFFNGFDGIDPRQVDRALWSFGRFLKSNYGSILTPTSSP